MNLHWYSRKANPVPQRTHDQVMGTFVYQEVYGINGAEAAERVNRELHRLEAMWSPFGKGTIIDAIGRAAGTSPVTVDPDSLAILSEAREIGIRSQGAFDITVSPLVRLWREAAATYLPPLSDEREKVRQLVGVGDLEISPGMQVSLKRPGQGIDLGGIGKGYGADRARHIYEASGIRYALITIGGNVIVLNTRPDGTPWKVGVKNPACPKGHLVGFIEAVNCSVVTSGDYEQYFEYQHPEGGIQRFHHIIDPRTGWSANSGLSGVTVVSASSSRADALATASYVLGMEKGMALCDSYVDTHVLFIDKSGGIHLSKGMSKIFHFQAPVLNPSL